MALPDKQSGGEAGWRRQQAVAGNRALSAEGPV